MNFLSIAHNTYYRNYYYSLTFLHLTRNLETMAFLVSKFITNVKKIFNKKLNIIITLIYLFIDSLWHIKTHIIYILK